MVTGLATILGPATIGAVLPVAFNVCQAALCSKSLLVNYVVQGQINQQHQQQRQKQQTTTTTRTTTTTTTTTMTTTMTTTVTTTRTQTTSPSNPSNCWDGD
ncbi:unnamed protein product [Polarella glacialis]|uniref:Uncharacterized protein n=1 Tax=Polarella glacialis TaxID=89957 RepID=A0A813DBV9_POLGL|nr:unnamed protein product [Polarella glacialis]